MSELHARFAAWVSGGADDELPRDLGIHAWGCAECLALAASLDALHRIDVGAAPEPPILASSRSIVPEVVRVGRIVAGVASSGFLIAAIVVGTGLLDASPAGVADAIATATTLPSASIAEGVLGGVPETPSDPTASATSSPKLAVMLPTPLPTLVPTPLPASASLTPAPVPAPSVATPRATPTATPVPPPPTSTVAPTSTPTLPPTPSPVPTPTGQPTPSPQSPPPP